MLLPPTVWTTFPAGWGKLGKATAGRLKGAGLKAGFPDILIFHQHGVVGIELKTKKGHVQPEQRDQFMRLEMVGIHTHICRTVDDVIEVLATGGISFRKGVVDGRYPKTKSRRPPQPDASTAPQTQEVNT